MLDQIGTFTGVPLEEERVIVFQLKLESDGAVPILRVLVWNKKAQSHELSYQIWSVNFNQLLLT